MLRRDNDEYVKTCSCGAEIGRFRKVWDANKADDQCPKCAAQVLRDLKSALSDAARLCFGK